MAESPLKLDKLEQRLQAAIERFWGTRDEQGQRQGVRTGSRDAGSRTQVTGGRHLDALTGLVAEVVSENCPDAVVHRQAHARDSATVLPGYFRPTKYWDLLVTHGDRLVACVELKSHVGPSFGNNYNNRSEEAVGSAVDVQTAYREGAFVPSPQPWIGYLMLLQETEKSISPVRNDEKHFKVFEEFDNASYAERYRVGITRLVREGLYSSACLLLSNSEGTRPYWREPSSELTFRRFVGSLAASVVAAAAE